VQSTTVDQRILKSMGDEALGVVSTGWVYAGLDRQQKKFVSDEPRLPAGPGLLPDGAYGAASDVEQNLKEVKGKIEDKPAFMAALRNAADQRPARRQVCQPGRAWQPGDGHLCAQGRACQRQASPTS
jgi:hypothetical protein